MALETLADQVRGLDEERAGVAAEAGDELGCEWVRAVVVQIVVVTRIERCARTRRPAKQRLRSQSRVERVVVEDQPCECRFRELIRAAKCEDVDLISHSTRIVPSQTLRVDTELRAQFIRRLICDAAIELEQTPTTRIQRRFLAQRQSPRAYARILAAIAKVEIEVSPTLRHLPVELNLLAVTRARVERKVLLVRRSLVALTIESTTTIVGRPKRIARLSFPRRTKLVIK